MSALEKLDTWKLAYALFRCMNFEREEANRLANKMNQTLDASRQDYPCPTEEDDTRIAKEFQSVLKEHQREKSQATAPVKEVGEEGFAA